jgi:hypothetical protein
MTRKKTSVIVELKIYFELSEQEQKLSWMHLTVGMMQVEVWVVEPLNSEKRFWVDVLSEYRTRHLGHEPHRNAILIAMHS